MNVYIKKDTKYYAPVKYTLKIIEKNRNVEFSAVANVENADLIWDHENTKSEYINLAFYENLELNSDNLRHEKIISDLPIKNIEKEDVISIIFYLVNCLQELNPQEDQLDHYNRFKYVNSCQYKYDIIEENIVEQLIDSFCTKHQIIGTKRRSKFFISHDIDSIYGSLVQDGFWALKNMKIGSILNIIAYELNRKPHWRNIDKMIKVNDEYDIKTTFFWLVNQGKGTQNINNADYNLKKEAELVKLVEQSNNTNGLHKSCSTMSIDEELEKGNIQSSYNRHHFLNFNSHTDWKKISESKLNFDCSLGFAEHYGFRNSYGKAFQPYDIVNQKPYDFVEAPLHFMDTTFHKYMEVPTDTIGQTIIDFYEKNNTNCDFSLLWHNIYFTNYKFNSFIDQYKKVLSFIYESKIECVSPKELIEENKITW